MSPFLTTLGRIFTFAFVRRRTAMKLLQGLSFVAQALSSLVPVGSDIFAKVAEASADGTISVDEGGAIGKVALQEPDIKIKIKGLDVLDDKAEELFGEAIGRVAVLAYNAAKG